MAEKITLIFIFILCILTISILISLIRLNKIEKKFKKECEKLESQFYRFDKLFNETEKQHKKHINKKK